MYRWGLEHAHGTYMNRPTGSGPALGRGGPFGKSGLVRAAAGDRAGGGGGVLADPLVLPGRVVLAGVAARAVDRGELTGDLLPVRGAAAGHLVRGHVDLPLRAGPAHPARRARVPEREALRGEVIGVAHVDHRVMLRPRVRIGLAQDRVDGRGR